MIISQASSGYSRTGLRTLVPALLTRMSTRPKCFMIRSTPWCTFSRSVTSRENPSDFRPSFRTADDTLFMSASFRPQIATSAPAFASASAATSPSPLELPVTIATFPVRSNIFRSIALTSRCPSHRDHDADGIVDFSIQGVEPSVDILQRYRSGNGRRKIELPGNHERRELFDLRNGETVRPQ